MLRKVNFSLDRPEYRKFDKIAETNSSVNDENEKRKILFEIMKNDDEIILAANECVLAVCKRSEIVAYENDIFHDLIALKKDPQKKFR